MYAKSQSSSLCIPTQHERERLMGILHGYFDESGKVDKPAVAFCGFVAAASRIQSFDDEWNSILRVYEMDSLHMSRVFKAHVPLSAKIRKQSFAERIETLKPFADCIRKHFEYGMAMALMWPHSKPCHQVRRSNLAKLTTHTILLSCRE